MTDAERAKAALAGHSVCLVKDGEIYISDKRGIAPLVEFIDSCKDFSGFCAADRIVGRTAALLYAHMGVKEVYAEVLSAGAEEVLRGHAIAYGYSLKTERIVNRRGDGMCPMEEAVAGITSPYEALEAVRKKMLALQAKSEEK